MDFAHLKQRAQYLLDNPDYCSSDEGMLDIVCRNCDFWKEDDRDYQCAGLAILRALIRKKIITPQEIVSALNE
jgi:hypothetical protein